MNAFKLSGLALAMLPLCLLSVEGTAAVPAETAVGQKAPDLQAVRWGAGFGGVGAVSFSHLTLPAICRGWGVWGGRWFIK